MNHKKLITGVMLAMTALGFQSFAALTGVKVTSGKESVTFSFESRPTVNFGSESIIVTSEQNSVEFPVSSNVSFEFVEGGTGGVDEISGKEPKISFSYSGIELQSFRPAGEVTIYDTAGMMLLKTSTDNEGNCFISSERLPKGYIIINVSNKSYKILN